VETKAIAKPCRSLYFNGFFGMRGGEVCPMIAQTLVNLSAGSRARLSGIVAALAILVIILFGAPVIELPIAALVMNGCDRDI
jgi:SulP family sulfate permease